MPTISRIMQMVSCNTDIPPSYEDLSTYTVVDPESNFTVTTTSVTATDIETSWVASYVYKDFGVGYFKTNFVINFEVVITSISAEDSDFYGLIKVSNAIGTSGDAKGPTAMLDYDSPTDTHWQFYAGDNNYATSYRNLDKLITPYYCTLERIANTPGVDDGQVILSVYSDPNRTTIMDGTIPRIDIPESYMVDLRYLLIAQTYRTNANHNAKGTYKVQNIEIVSNG